MIVIALTMVGSFVAGWVGIIALDPGEELVFLISMGCAGGLIGILSMAFFRFFVELDPNLLRFGFSFWNVELPLDQIESVQATEIRPLKFGGLGWRMDRQKRIGYICCRGDGIELTTRAGRVYVFNCDKANSLVEQLSKNLPCHDV